MNDNTQFIKEPDIDIYRRVEIERDTSGEYMISSDSKHIKIFTETASEDYILIEDDTVSMLSGIFIQDREYLTDTILNKQLREILEKSFQYSDSGLLLVVSMDYQRMYCISREGKMLEVYPVSTSKYGIGSESGSNKTPVGFHRIEDKLGDNEPSGMQFRWKKATGKVLEIYTDSTNEEDDWVTTRIMHLKGLEEGKNLGNNVDSYERHIYIHGTQEEGLIGSPASHGCIRMKNQDVIDLYNLVNERDIVYILKMEE